MKIVIDTSPLKSGHLHRGVGSYTRSLVEALRMVDKDNEFILTSLPQHTEADLIHYPYFDFFFLTLPLSKVTPTVVTVHDTIPLLFPNQYPRGVRGIVKLAIQKRSLAGVKAIVTDSETSKRDIVKYLKQPEQRVHRIYLAADKEYQKAAPVLVEQVLKTYAITQPYFLYVGDINFNKNLPHLIKSFAKLKTKHELVMVSRAMKKNIPEALELVALIKKLKLSQKVKVLTDIPLDPKDELCALYTGADWYIQPSLYEGFGLPVLEAWACGTPVIASTGGSLAEIVGEAGVTFDPSNKAELANALHRAVSMAATERDSFINKGKNRNRDFIWQTTAKETIAVYRQVLGI